LSVISSGPNIPLLTIAASLPAAWLLVELVKNSQIAVKSEPAAAIFQSI
jgi:hypothetical protein